MTARDGEAPHVWGRWFVFTVTFILGGVAGLILAAVTARRLGYAERAQRYVLWGAIANLAAAVASYPLPSGGEWRYVNNAISAGFAAVWMMLMERDIQRFQSEGGSVASASWVQGIGLGLIGLLVSIVVFGGLALFLSTVGFPTLDPSE